MIDPNTTAEVTRLVTDGTKHAASKLYAACARACEAMGFEKIQTYILDTEPGTSVIAAGWSYELTTDGGEWGRPSRHRKLATFPIVKKQRYGKILT